MESDPPSSILCSLYLAAFLVRCLGIFSGFVIRTQTIIAFSVTRTLLLSAWYTRLVIASELDCFAQIHQLKLRFRQLMPYEPDQIL